jgi:hypothetical protein
MPAFGERVRAGEPEATPSASALQISHRANGWPAGRAQPYRVRFVGRFHRCLVMTPAGPRTRDGGEAVVRKPPGGSRRPSPRRAVFDTAPGEVVPCELG